MVDDVLLPYRTDWREMRAVLDYCKGKGVERATLEARFGAGESLRETLNALEQLGLVERSEGGDVRLTADGDAVAYAPDPEQLSARLIDALVAFPPYRYPLERAVADATEVLDGPWIEHIWQVDMRLGQPRNRVEEARTFFFRLADDAGLGVYRRGVRGQTTRLDLAPTFADRVRPALERRAERASAASEADDEPIELSTTGVAGVSDAPPGVPPLASVAPQISPAERTSAPAALSIHVDMSDWELDKIGAFLEMIGYPLRNSAGE